MDGCPGCFGCFNATNWGKSRRYISLERLIEEAKDRYYETLEQSSGGWHEARNDPWPYVNYITMC